MATATAPQVQCKTASEVRNVAVDFQGKLDASELLTGTPTVVEVTTSDLTLSDKVVSTGALTILGKTVATGEAVQFKVLGGTAGTSYTIRITAATNSTPAQTLIVDLTLRVVAD